MDKGTYASCWDCVNATGAGSGVCNGCSQKLAALFLLPMVGNGNKPTRCVSRESRNRQLKQNKCCQWQLQQSWPRPQAPGALLIHRQWGWVTYTIANAVPHTKIRPHTRLWTYSINHTSKHILCSSFLHTLARALSSHTPSCGPSQSPPHTLRCTALHTISHTSGPTCISMFTTSTIHSGALSNAPT